MKRVLCGTYRFLNDFFLLLKRKWIETSMALSIRKKILVFLSLIKEEVD
ncbi:hypothetical protein LEP1GSC046_0908 [Leptospira kirschneri serovar Bim str. 1051]|nr:hypothetical protein LEP1GSC042_0328 [Leptospira kirschneri serovar Bim str. PUO 1247]EMN03028.1 hypothetical protein LEP1GSC046_0908 [Leptospira kirschneri serovar Bim str. 1051]